MDYTHYIKIYIDKNTHTDTLYDYLNNIDYEKLEYKDEMDTFILFNYIGLRNSYRYFDNDKLYNIMKKQSLILYYSILLTINGDDNYIKLILSLKPETKLEKIIFLYIENRSELISPNVDKKKSIIEHIINETKKIAEDNIIFNKIINNTLIKYTKNPEKEPEKHKICDIINYIDICISRYHYNKIDKYMDILKLSKVSKNLIEWLDLTINLLRNNYYYKNPEEIILCLERNYNNFNTEIEELYLELKFSSLIRLTFLLNRTTFNTHKYIFYKEFSKYYNKNISIFDANKYKKQINHINRNYYGFQLNNYYISKEEKKEYNDKLIIILEELLINGTVVNNVLDLLLLYNINKNYQKVLEIYNKYKNFLASRIDKDSKFNITLINSIAPALIDTHQIQNIDEFKNLLTDMNGNCSRMDNELKRFENICNTLIKMETTLTKIGFNIIKDYDYKTDNRGLKDEDDKLVCPICVETIEQEKITVIECKYCHRYIGHMKCIAEYITKQSKQYKNISCIICRGKY